MSGVVEHLFIAEAAGTPMQPMASLVTVPGRGIEGDRYFTKRGHWSGMRRPVMEVTFIDADEIEAVADVIGMPLEPHEVRRNVITRGVDLNSLLGMRFTVGEVTFNGLAPDAPCRYLQELLGKPIQRPMLGKAGLRAGIETPGSISVGDDIVVVGPADQPIERPVVPLMSGMLDFDFAQWTHTDDSWWIEERLRERPAVIGSVHAPDCTCCGHLLATLATLHEELSDRADVVVLSPWTIRQNATFAAERDLAMPLLQDGASWTANDLGVFRDGQPQPAVFVVLRDRTITLSWSDDAGDEPPDCPTIRTALGLKEMT